MQGLSPPQSSLLRPPHARTDTRRRRLSGMAHRHALLCAGSRVAVVDNFARRDWVAESGSDCLTPIAPARAAGRRVEGGLRARTIDVHTSATSPTRLRRRASSRDFQPEAIVHYGEQPSAPVLDDRPRARGLHPAQQRHRQPQRALRDARPRAGRHLVKLGTMGEYGTPNIDIEEGFIEIEHNGRTDTLPFPKLPGLALPPARRSTTRQHPLRLPRSGACARPTSTRASSTASRPTRPTLDPRLRTRFDYDEVFGTALNRFCVQAVIGHPLTVYGSGGQTRGFLNIRDTLQCVELAVENPADARRVPGLQPVHRAVLASELAELVSRPARSSASRSRSSTSTTRASRPRSTTTTPTHTKLLDLGLEPHLPRDELVHR